MNDEEEYKKLVSKIYGGYDVKIELVAKIEEGYDVNYVGNGVGSLLHSAASAGDIDLVRLLVNSHADINIKDAQRGTPLHRTSLPYAYAIAELLIENGADVNAFDENGDTPIHDVARYSSLNLLKLLIENGANVNARNHRFDTPLHCAAGKLSSGAFAIRTDAEPIINELIIQGADVNAVNAKGKTPLHIASMSGAENVIDMLLRAGANDEITDSYGYKPEDCVFSLGALYLGETLRRAISNTVRIHLKTLLRKEAQFKQADDYGIINRTK